MRKHEPVGYNPLTTPYKQEALSQIAGHLIGSSCVIAKRYSQYCVVADMTAGPGIDEDGNEGSPLILARIISNVMATHDYEIYLVCVEREIDRLDHLRVVMSQRFPDLQKYVIYHADQLWAKNNSIPVSAYGLTYWDPTGYLGLDSGLLRAFGVTHETMDILFTRQGHAARRMLGWEKTAPYTLTTEDYLAATGKRCHYTWQYAPKDEWKFGFADNWEKRPQDKMYGMVRVNGNGTGQEQLPWE